VHTSLFMCNTYTYVNIYIYVYTVELSKYSSNSIISYWKPDISVRIVTDFSEYPRSLGKYPMYKCAYTTHACMHMIKHICYTCTLEV
jgi:hypothetical protein